MGLKYCYTYQKSVLKELENLINENRNESSISPLTKERLDNYVVSSFWKVYNSKGKNFLKRFLSWILNSRMREVAYNVSVTNNPSIKSKYILGKSNMEDLYRALDNIQKTIAAKYDSIREGQDKAGFHYNNYKIKVNKEQYTEMGKLLDSYLV